MRVGGKLSDFLDANLTANTANIDIIINYTQYLTILNTMIVGVQEQIYII